MGAKKQPNAARPPDKRARAATVRRHATALAALLALLALCVAGAQADPAPPTGTPADGGLPAAGADTPSPDPSSGCGTLDQTVAGSCDTELTPQAKDGCSTGWSQIAGSVYPGASLCNKRQYDAALTPPNLDFFTVRMRNANESFAGGAVCSDPSAATLDECEPSKRVPVIYRYTAQPGTAGTWQQTTLPGGAGGASPSQGYVGAVAYMADGHALAVGGTGVYPRREAARPSTPQNDPAGLARAWYFDGSSWRELEGLPAEPDGQPMRGFDALDCSPRQSDGEHCFAGAYRQLWEFKDGSFVQGLDDQSTSGIDSGADLSFRVRSIRFAPDGGRALAGTAGCCTASASSDAATLLAWFPGRGWQKQVDPANQPPTAAPDSYYAVFPYGGLPASIRAPGGPAPGPGDPPEPTSYPPGPESGASSNGAGITDVSSVAPVRLVAGDGDYSRYGCIYATDVDCEHSNSGATTGQPTWDVGELTGGGQPERGVAWTSAQGGTLEPSLSCPGGSSLLGEQYGTTCQPPSASALLGQTQSNSLFYVSSWALNSYSMPTAAEGWGVGDRGAIVHLGGHGSGPPEPAGPDVTTDTAAPLPDSAPYDAFRSPLSTGAPGLVPARDSQPLEPAAPPQFVAGGSPDPTVTASGEGVVDMVMSPDGSQGWALGPDPSNSDGSHGVLTLYHYRAGRWTRCEIDGVGAGKVLPPDPACASLSSIYRDENGSLARVSLTALARVPSSPGSDDFQLIAAGPGVTVLRYKDGRWFVDSAAESEIGSQGWSPTSIAFATPDDGWLTFPTSPGSGLQTEVYHYHRGRWALCASGGDAACDDAAGLLPLAPNAATGPIGVTTAGDRVYLYTSRQAEGQTGSVSAFTGVNQSYPIILHHDPGGAWTAADGGYDPGAAAVPDASQQGEIVTLSVVRASDRSYSGWAVGAFGGQSGDSVAASASASDTAHRLAGAKAVLLRLGAGGGWSAWHADDAASDYLFKNLSPALRVLALAQPLGDLGGVIAPGGDRGWPTGPLLGFSDREQRWQVLPAPWAGVNQSLRGQIVEESGQGDVRTLAPDGDGGFWIAVKRIFGRRYLQPDFFYHYTARVHEPVFTDVPHPIREQATAAAAGGDASLWVTTASANLYRYDRVTGWDRVNVSGWQPGRLITHPAAMRAVAVAPGGDGLVVGDGGRIADLAHDGVRLDPATATRCSGNANQPPCATGYTLDAAAVAPDGSALAGGEQGELLWRPAGGGFRAVATPDHGSATITAIAMPLPDRAWFADDLGQVFAGTLDGGDWSWTLEDVTGDGTLLSEGVETGSAEPLRALAIDGSGHGFAVGDRGTILERSGAGSWSRLNVGVLDNLTSVALPVGGGPGALIGGWGGLILTYVDGHFEIAQAADPYDGVFTGETDSDSARTVGMALLPGERSGEVEAWAVSQVPEDGLNRSPAPTAALHYTSDPSDPLLDGGAGRAAALPDSAPRRPGELDFAAFGKSECAVGAQVDCPESSGSHQFNELVAGRIAAEIGQGASSAGGPAFALWTGDVSNVAQAGSGTDSPGYIEGYTPVDVSYAHRRFAELIADPLGDTGVPLFGALGGQDLSGGQACNDVQCAGPGQAGAGESLGWRQALAGVPAPWGAGREAPPESHGLSFVPVPGSGIEGASVSTPSGSASAGGAHTHYALDVVRGQTPIARLVVIDTSLKTFAAAAGEQNPAESQLAWLRSVLCIQGEEQAPGDDCTRSPSEQAIVVSEDPTYSYGPAATDTEADGATLESLLLQYKANVVISGRLGWNGRYWALAAGVHYPCPGGSYPAPGQFPTLTSTHPCQQANVSQADQGVASAQQLAAGLLSTAAPAGPTGCQGPGPNQTGTLPFVVASSAGGEFAPDAPTSGDIAGQGYWHGYTIVRLDQSGDPACTIVEQRPVFDWLGIDAPAHALAPGQHMTLKGYGREPVGTDTPIEYDAIDSPAITHRYDLLEADSTKPYLPKTDPDGNYIPLDPSVATVDSETGKVQTGKGNHGRVYAIGLLSAGKQAATWPLVFEPRRSYVPPQPHIITAAVPPALHEPPLKLLGASAESLPTTPPATPPVTPTVANLNFPAPPALPSLPTPAATPVNPPAPPAPPPPPASNPPSGLNLLAKPVGLNVAPPTSPVPPPSPPINPAPPGGARKEARQRQAAAAKSEEGSAGEQTKASAGDLATGPIDSGSAMTRRDRVTPAADGFTPLARASDQPSAWTTDLEWGGGTLLMALVLALGYTTVRPTPRGRRRPGPEVTPAPAYARRRRW